MLRSTCHFVTAMLVIGFCLEPTTAATQSAPVLHVLSCAARSGNIPLTYSRDTSFPVTGLRIGKRRGAMIDVGVSEGSYTFQLQSPVPFILAVYRKSADGRSWVPQSAQSATAPYPGSSPPGFRVDYSAPTPRKEAVFRFAIVPAAANRGETVQMRMRWRADCDGCPTLASRGFSDAAHTLSSANAALSIYNGSTTLRSCVRETGARYICAIDNRSGAFRFQWYVQETGSVAAAASGKARKRFRITPCSGNPAPYDVTIEYDKVFPSPPAPRTRTVWVQLTPGTTPPIWSFY